MLPEHPAAAAPRQGDRQQVSSAVVCGLTANPPDVLNRSNFRLKFARDSIEADWIG